MPGKPSHRLGQPLTSGRSSPGEWTSSLNLPRTDKDELRAVRNEAHPPAHYFIFAALDLKPYHFPKSSLVLKLLYNTLQILRIAANSDATGIFGAKSSFFTISITDC